MTADPALWSSLPVPALLLDEHDRVEMVNPAAESFLNLSARALVGEPVWDKVMIDAPLEEPFARARAGRSSLYVNDVDVGSGERPPVQCNIQVAPLLGAEGKMLMMISPREIAGRMSHNAHTGKAAKSAIGMLSSAVMPIRASSANSSAAARHVPAFVNVPTCNS